MQKITVTWLVIFLSFTLVLAACGGSNNSGETDAGNNNTVNTSNGGSNNTSNPSGENDELVVNTELKGEIDVWTWSPQLMEVLLPGFNKYYPNIKVNVVSVPDVRTKLITVLAAGTGAPDVSMMAVGTYPTLSSIEGLENLLEAPYNAGRSKEDFPPGYWD